LQAEAWMLTSLGGVHGQFREFEQAITCLEQAIAICAEIGDPWGGARAMHFRGLAELGMLRFEELSRGTPGVQKVGSLQGSHENGDSVPWRPYGAVAIFEKALKISQDIGDLYRQGRLMGNVGEVYWRLGRPEQAICCLEQGLAICRKICDPRGIALALYNLAEVNRNRGHLEDAIDYYREALVIRRDIRDPWGEARVLQALGLALQHVEGAAAARDCWVKALAIFSRLGEPEAEEVRAYLLALEGARLGET
ncbi:MAG TPA: tetratricopeptide repeat protein, partial [Actinomycetota bacterium]